MHFLLIHQLSKKIYHFILWITLGTVSPVRSLSSSPRHLSFFSHLNKCLTLLPYPLSTNGVQTAVVEPRRKVDLKALIISFNTIITQITTDPNNNFIKKWRGNRIKRNRIIKGLYRRISHKSKSCFPKNFSLALRNANLMRPKSSIFWIARAVFLQSNGSST